MDKSIKEAIIEISKEQDNLIFDLMFPDGIPKYSLVYKIKMYIGQKYLDFKNRNYVYDYDEESIGVHYRD